jgi:hypothetical protein
VTSIYLYISLQYLDILLHLQVTIENYPGEIFINISPTKCWNMVRERLNMEIRRQLNMGRDNLPTLQPTWFVKGSIWEVMAMKCLGC